MPLSWCLNEFFVTKTTTLTYRSTLWTGEEGRGAESVSDLVEVRPEKLKKSTEFEPGLEVFCEDFLNRIQWFCNDFGGCEGALSIQYLVLPCSEHPAALAQPTRSYSRQARLVELCPMSAGLRRRAYSFRARKPALAR